MTLEHDTDVKEAKRLIELGYKFKYDQYGYQVWFKDEYLHGAGIIGKPKMHWRHRDANLVMYLGLCVREAQKHEHLI